MDEDELPIAYQVWEVDCPECSEVIRLGYDMTPGEQVCDSCGAEFEVTT